MKDIHYQEDDFEKAGKSIGSLIGKGAWGKGTIDHLKKVSKNLEEVEKDIATYDTDGVISFQHTSQTSKYQEIFEDFDVLYRFSDQIGDIVNNTIDHPFYEKLDDFVAGMRDLDATTFTTENRIGATTTTTQFENSYTQKQVEVPKSKVSLEDLFSGDTFYADQMKLQYDAWKQTNKGEDVSHQDFQAAMLNSRAFAYTSIKDEQQKTEFWTLVVATIVIVGVFAFCPLAGVALSAAYGTLEISAAKTGKDWMTGRELDATERAQRGAFAVLDVIPGVKALTGGVQMMRSGSRLANVSDALLQGVKNVPTQVGDIAKLGQTQMRTRMASLKTATQDALQVATQKGLKELDKVGQTATAMKGSLNLPPRAHLALAGMGGIPNQAPSKIAQGTENLKDVLRKFDVNLGGGGKRADGIMEGVSGLTKAQKVENFQNRINDIRNKMPNNPLKKRGNMAAADVNIKGLPEEFVAHSKINSNLDKGADVENFSTLKPEGERIFKNYEPSASSIDGTKFDRFHDTEAKILEDIASKIKDPNTSGSIDLFTELPTCQSCSNIILEFREKFPNIKLNIFTK
ncbi:deaminase domain-containing protein [Listeria sp. ILCC797]|uniref:deaminase domain-containing protein n=1 Tax=Listeria sp. ILCC797 TaxID=1918333 RepID=UPI00210092DE|nr:deaminase domain-containing protein [Listeria sp. ILCC797]